jgi:hypothetical protein
MDGVIAGQHHPTSRLDPDPNSNPSAVMAYASGLTPSRSLQGHASPRRVPDREGSHAIEPISDGRSPDRIAPNDYLGVAAGPERLACALGASSTNMPS